MALGIHSLFPAVLYGQRHKPTHCELLQKALSAKTSFKSFFDSNTVIIDTLGYFENCQVNIQGKQLTIVKQCAPLFPFLRGSATSEECYTKYRNHIVCTVLKSEEGKKLVLWFWRPSNNETINITLTVKRNKIIVKPSMEGQF